MVNKSWLVHSRCLLRVALKLLLFKYSNLKVFLKIEILGFCHKTNKYMNVTNNIFWKIHYFGKFINFLNIVLE